MLWFVVMIRRYAQNMSKSTICSCFYGDSIECTVGMFVYNFNRRTEHPLKFFSVGIFICSDMSPGQVTWTSKGLSFNILLSTVSWRVILQKKTKPKATTAAQQNEHTKMQYKARNSSLPQPSSIATNFATLEWNCRSTMSLSPNTVLLVSILVIATLASAVYAKAVANDTSLYVDEPSDAYGTLSRCNN